MARLDAVSRLSRLVAAADVDLSCSIWTSLHRELARYGLAIVIAWLRSGQQPPGDATSDAIIDAVVRSVGAEEPVATTAHSSSTTTSQPTPGQLQVLRLVAEGLTNPEIAERLRVKPSTVGNHLTQLADRLGTDGAQRAKLAAIGVRQGWIP